jgi:hypothetical protein
MKDHPPAWFTHSSLGTWDPEGCLVCVIDDPAEATRAVGALQAAGFAAEHLRLFLAGELLAFSEALHHRSVPKQVFFFLTNLTDDAQFEAEYREEARHGHPILVIYAPRQERYTKARALLQGYHPHTVKYYGRWVVRGLG